MDILKACVVTEIAMFCLPPNSTDKLQPLDVGVFRSLKSRWREVLREFKQKFPKKSGVDKCEFPPLLKKTLLKADLSRHLPNAFAACGLVPITLEKSYLQNPTP